MNRKQIRKQPYATPQIRVIPTACEHLMAGSGSVQPSVSGSGMQTGYYNKGEHDVGKAHFGDPSEIAPAKQGWFEEDEEEE